MTKLTPPSMKNRARRKKFFAQMKNPAKKSKGKKIKRKGAFGKKPVT